MVIGRTEQAAATDSDSFAFSHAARGQTSATTLITFNKIAGKRVRSELKRRINGRRSPWRKITFAVIFWLYVPFCFIFLKLELTGEAYCADAIHPLFPHPKTTCLLTPSDNIQIASFFLRLGVFATLDSTARHFVGSNINLVSLPPPYSTNTCACIFNVLFYCSFWDVPLPASKSL